MKVWLKRGRRLANLLRKRNLSQRQLEEVQPKDGKSNMASDHHTKIPEIIDSIVIAYKNYGVKRFRQKIKVDDPYSSAFINYKPDYTIERTPTNFTGYFIVFEIISDQHSDKTAHDLLKIIGKRNIRKAIFISTTPEKKKETDKILAIHLGQLKSKFKLRTKKELQDISSLEIKKDDPDEKIRKRIYDELLPVFPKTKEFDRCVLCSINIPMTQIICKKCDNGKHNKLKDAMRRLIKETIKGREILKKTIKGRELLKRSDEYLKKT